VAVKSNQQIPGKETATAQGQLTDSSLSSFNMTINSFKTAVNELSSQIRRLHFHVLDL
jgi:hypothetical protein